MILFALAAAAAQPKHMIQSYGFPDHDSCGYWTEQRRNQSGNAAPYEGWVFGFITGLNTFGQNNGDVAPGVKADGIIGWVDQYCAAHPLDSVTTAAFKLADELRERGDKK